MPLSRSIAMSCGQTPRRRHDGPHRIRWGLSRGKRRGGCRAGPLGVQAATGEPPGIHDVEPRRVALQAGPEGLPPAVRTNRNAGKRGVPKPCSRPLSDNRHAVAAALDGKRRGVKGTLAARAAAPPVSRKRGDGSPISTQLPHARPGRCAAAPGRGRPCFARATRLDALSACVACGWCMHAEPPWRRRRGTSVQRGAKHVRGDRPSKRDHGSRLFAYHVVWWDSVADRSDAGRGVARPSPRQGTTRLLRFAAALLLIRRRSLLFPECPTATAVAGATLNYHRASRIEDDASVFFTILILGIDHLLNVLGFGIEPSTTRDIVFASCCHCSTLPL